MNNTEVVAQKNSSSVVAKKVQEAASKVAEPVKKSETADDFDNIQVAESADAANSADQFATAGDEDDDDEDVDEDEDDETQVQQSAETTTTQVK